MVSENYHNYHTQFTHHMKGIFILGKGCSHLVPLFSSAFLFLVSEVSNLHLVEIFLLLHSLNSSRIIEIVTLMR